MSLYDILEYHFYDVKSCNVFEGFLTLLVVSSIWVQLKSYLWWIVTENDVTGNCATSALVGHFHRKLHHRNRKSWTGNDLINFPPKFKYFPPKFEFVATIQIDQSSVFRYLYPINRSPSDIQKQPIVGPKPSIYKFK